VQLARRRRREHGLERPRGSLNAIALDAGALIALENNDRAVWAALKLAVAKGAEVIVLSTVHAQLWRGTAGQVQLSKALEFCVQASLDPLARRSARSVGEQDE